MKKIWRVAIYEYLHHVRRKRFIFALISMPLFVGFIVVLGMVVARLQYDSAPFGYVDLSGFLSNPQMPPANNDPVMPDAQMIRYEDEQSAQNALVAGAIQSYYVIEPDYLKTGAVRMINKEKMNGQIVDQFSRFLRYNLLIQVPDDVANRITDGSDFIIRSLDGSREMKSDQWWNILLPIISGVVLIIIINISSGYLLQAVVDEKENRTIEIIITSVSPTQMMAGKIIGNLSVGLTQLLIWLVFTVLAFLAARQYFFPDLQIMVDFGYLVMTAAVMLLAFIMISALMAMVGSTTTERREAQQVATFFTLPMVVPFWFIASLMETPNSGLSVFMSIFPFTAPIALPLRAAFTTLPAWQTILAFVLLFGCVLGSIWLAGRAFRLGMLRFGKPLSLKEIFRKA